LTLFSPTLITVFSWPSSENLSPKAYYAIPVLVLEIIIYSAIGVKLMRWREK
jgi:hypothetical protein